MQSESLETILLTFRKIDPRPDTRRAKYGAQ